MEFSKKKYTKEEVKKIVSELSENYENRLAEQKARISELVKESSRYKSELDAFSVKDAEISAAIKRAEEYERDVKRKTDVRYTLAVESLSAFIGKWNAYFNYLKEKYPMYSVVREAVAVNDKIRDIIGVKDAETVIYTAESEIDKVAKRDGAFDPKAKIAEYIAATSENGFNMDEVLNPGSLELEDLCKELGLLTEDE